MQICYLYCLIFYNKGVIPRELVGYCVIKANVACALLAMYHLISRENKGRDREGN